MMASPNNTIKTNTLKRPLVVIKKGSIFKPNCPVVLRTPLKRPIANVSATQGNPDAKRTCVTVPDPVRSVVCTYVINEVKQETIEYNTNNAHELTSNACIPHSLEEVTLLKELDQSYETPEQSHAIKQEEKLVLSDHHYHIQKTSNTEPVKKRTSQLYMCKIEGYVSNKTTRCEKHGVLPEYKAEDLLKEGDAFSSLQGFDEYINKQAMKWFFYYTRSDSRNLKTGHHYKSKLPTYINYSCRFNKRCYKSKAKGIRKRRETTLYCPAGLTLKCLPGKDEYLVLNVCHHHTHELSAAVFDDTPHGYRLPQEIKDEIRDLTLFNLDTMTLRWYLESKLPGISMKRTIYNRKLKARKCDSKDAMSPERVEEILAKIKYIKANFNAEGRINGPKSVKGCESDSSKQTPIMPKEAPKKNQILASTNKAGKDKKISYDQEVIQSVKELHKSSYEEQENASETSVQNIVNASTYAESEMVESITTNTDDTTNDTKPLVFVEDKPKMDSTKTFTHYRTIQPVGSKMELFPVETRCQRRHVKFPEHKAEGLVKVGDTFSSMEEFASYAAGHALKWFFYYQVHDSRNVKTTKRYNSRRKTWYNLTCRFNKGWYKSTSTGLRKIKRKTIRCPAMISMMCNPGDDKFTVVYVCHHHSHELSYEVFKQEAHGHRLSPELKDEIRELAWFQLDRRLMRQYLQEKTGFDLKATIKNVLGKMRLDKQKLYLTPEKQKEILKKIEAIKQNFTIPKRAPRKKNQTNEEDRSDSEDEEGGSRLEARLNNILYDEELIQSVKELQESTGCEIQIVPWENVNMQTDDVSHLQAGLPEDTTCSELQPRDDDSYDTQVEIDQDLYTMDENVHYIIPSDHKESNILIADDTQQCDEIIHKNALTEVQENTQLTPNDTPEAENSDENDYQMMYQYTNDEDCIDEHTKVNKCSNETYESRDVGMQADLEIIELDRYFEEIQNLESSMVKEDLEQSKIRVNTRGRPKVVLEEGIINRFNIDLYINVGGIIPCLEQLAVTMNMSVLNLLNKLYQGEAVFKLSVGRSGKHDRKTVQLIYVPLTISIPYGKHKYINCLQEYKNMCSKYSDVTIKLESTIESISADLKDNKEKLKTIESENHKVIKNYETLAKDHALNQQLIKKNLEQLDEVRNVNKVLLKNLKNLEFLNVTQTKDHALQQQLLRNCQEELAKAQSENQVLLEKVKHQESLLNKPRDNIILIENSNVIEDKSPTGPTNLVQQIKTLEQALKLSDADKKLYRNKIKDVENLYYSDSKSLLEKIESLEKELGKYKANELKNTNQSTLQTYVSENGKLRKEIKELQEQISAETNKNNDKVKTLERMVIALHKRLDEEKRKYVEIQNYHRARQADPLA